MTTIELPDSYYADTPVQLGRTAAVEHLQRPGPVYRVGSIWLITSYEGVRYAQKHPELFSSAKAFDGIANAIQMIPIAIDPPKHADYRRILDPMFGPKRMEAMDADLRAQLRGHIDAFAPLGRCDVVADLSYKFPTQAILTLFGLPPEHLPTFLEWVTGIIKGADIASLGTDQPQSVIDCSIGLFGFLAEQLEIKRSRRGDDMLSNILALDGDNAWTDAEILGLCFLIILAGLDTVTGAIGFSLHTLANDPALRHRLIDNPALIAPFVEEMLRLEGPVPGVPRVTTADVEVEGVHIPANSQVMLMLFTANREGENAHTMDLSAKPTHLGFGGGIHRCLGSHLARRELRLTVEEFHARIPDYRQAGEATVLWPAGTFGLESLPLEFDPC
ncbi:cytochrome P450 [Mycobacterium sp. shizuoka-1]|uniref:cytochrome P450 n=1 Tax=Mycobacterium sp. shizuoka-1 TaxID=2039281 RepID=UPI000C0604AB|nr:cytochrome P450 [Mycobacterium sp. shizuoka-1]GAY18644.1 putative cytochrome P450 143 [Mycobacterium sp. shizuoka-1]